MIEIGDRMALSSDQDGFGYQGEPVEIIVLNPSKHWDLTVKNADDEELDLMLDELELLHPSIQHLG